MIGEIGWENHGSENVHDYDKQPKGKVIPWEEAKEWLDYNFDDGFGAPNCNAIYVWT